MPGPAVVLLGIHVRAVIEQSPHRVNKSSLRCVVMTQLCRFPVAPNVDIRAMFVQQPRNPKVGSVQRGPII